MTLNFLLTIILKKVNSLNFHKIFKINDTRIKFISLIMLCLSWFALIKSSSENGRFLIIFILSILFFGLYQLNSNSLYAIRLINSLLACGTMYYLACSQNLFNLYPKYYFIIAACLYSLGIYTYFWEYTYIFSLLLAPLVYSKNYFFALLNVAFLLLIGQRTSILNIGFLVYATFLNGKLSFLRFFGFLIIIIIFFLSFSYIDIRALNVFKEISFRDLYLAISSAIDIALVLSGVIEITESSPLPILDISNVKESLVISSETVFGPIVA